MSLQEIKRMLSEFPCDPMVALKAMDIMNAAIKRGRLLPAERDTLVKLLDLDIEAHDIEAEALESTAASLKTYAREAGRLAGQTSTELEKINSSLASA